MMVKTWQETPLGRVLLAGDEAGLCGLWFEGQQYFGAGLAVDAMAERADLPAFEVARAWLEAYFAGERPDVGQVPLAPQGTAFRQAVWAQLLAVPYGAVTTYGAIAQALGKAAGAAQAVGGAVGHNPISILIPCHRVIGAGGGLTGYAGGLARKRALLALEGARR